MYIIKKTVLSAYFIIASFALIAITFPILNLGVFPNYFLLDLCYIISITAICFMLPLGFQAGIEIFALICQFLILTASASLYLSRGDVFSWDLILQIFQLKAVTDSIRLPIFTICIGSLFILIYVSLLIFIKRPKIELMEFYNKTISFIILGIVIISSIGNLTTHLVIKNKYKDGDYYRSDAFMYNSYSSAISSLKKFGVYGYYFEDFFRQSFPSLQPKIRNNTSNFDYNNYTSILNGLCEDNNVFMVYAESFDIYAISKELTPILYSLKNGVNLSESGILDYYNVSKNNNSTSISRKDFDYNPTNNTFTYNGTNIYSNTIINEVGLELSNHFSRETTNYSEVLSLCSMIKSKNSLLKLLNDNYSTNYIHGNKSKFYNRHLYIKDLYFEDSRFYENMQHFCKGSAKTLNCCTLDSETIKYYTDNQSEFNCFPTEENFFTYFMTVTTHGFYTYNDLLLTNYAFVDAISNSSICGEIFNLYNSLNQPLKTTMREYFARVLDTEYALAYAINYFHENNILDKTIIILAGDHIPHDNGITEFKTLYLENILQQNKYNYNNLVECFIYATQITNAYLEQNNENRKIYHLTESADLTPTILTLLGIRYNQDQYLGFPVINKISNNSTLYNPLHRSFYYGCIESETLFTYDGQKIQSKDPNYNPTQEEINQFIKDFNYIFEKYYYILEQITGS